MKGKFLKCMVLCGICVSAFSACGQQYETAVSIPFDPTTTIRLEDLQMDTNIVTETTLQITTTDFEFKEQPIIADQDQEIEDRKSQIVDCHFDCKEVGSWGYFKI